MKIRLEYQKYGDVKTFYRTNGNKYRNPHEPQLRRVILKYLINEWSLDLSNVLDLACGSGEVTLALKDHATLITGMDPYTYDNYRQRTGQLCQSLSFQDIAIDSHDFVIDDIYSVIICSYALHLLDRSWLPLLLYRLAEWTDTLIILSPHKQPHIKATWGWSLVQEVVDERIHVRMYKKCKITTQSERDI